VGYTLIGGKLRDINNQQFDSGHFTLAHFALILSDPVAI